MIRFRFLQKKKINNLNSFQDYRSQLRDIALNARTTRSVIWIFSFTLLKMLIQGPKSKSRSPEEHQDLVCASGGNQKICIPKDYQKYDLPTTKGLGIRVTQLFKQRLKPSEFQDRHLLQLELTSRIFRKYQTRILASH